MLNLVRFMQNTRLAVQFKELSNSEDTPLYKEVLENYEKMEMVLVEAYNN